MKMFVFALVCLLTCPSVYAGLCTQPDILQNAQANLTKMQANYSAGVASSYDVLTAEKQVLELKLCLNGDDSVLFQTLAENTMKRLHLAGAISNAGLAQACPDLLRTVKNEYNSGTKSSQDVSAIQAACAALRKN